MLMCSAVTLQPHKSITEVKLNSNVVYIKQMLPLFFVYLLFTDFAVGILVLFMQLMDIYVSHTEAYSVPFEGADFKVRAYIYAH